MSEVIAAALEDAPAAPRPGVDASSSRLAAVPA
jgi:hypothetical protein